MKTPPSEAMSTRPDIDHAPSRRGSPSSSEPQGRSGQEPQPTSEQEQIARLYSMTDDLLAVISLDGRFKLLNPAWEQALGWKRQEMVGRALEELVHPEDLDQTMALTLAGADGPAHLVNFSNRFRHRDGSWRWLLWSARCDGESWFAAAKDVTDRIWLERQALHDPLTKLPNRLLLMDRTRRALTRLQRAGGLIALLFIDLDRFKAVNDNLGHAVGDDLLVSVSERLADVLRDSDTVARLGGDEFVILAEDLDSDAEALSLAERVLHALEEPITVGSAVVSMQASVGISVCHEPDRDPEDLLREADVAMYRAKGSGGRGLGLFDEALRQEVAERLEMEDRLRDALARHELRLVFQPLFSLSDLGVVGCEALVRWHPHDAPPAAAEEFMHLAEGSKLIVEIGDWALQTACVQGSTWHREGRQTLIAVNISARGIAETDIAERVREALLYSGLPAEYLCVEVSESAVLRDIDRARGTLRACKALGVKVALDNFGANGSSLSLPSELPLDAIKIDRSLIAGFEEDRFKRGVVMAATAFAREAGITPIAVGIETERQLELARAMGCSLGQGFLLREPDAPERLRLDGPQAVRSPLSWRSIARLRRRPHPEDRTS